jgi:hypothetical protein
VACEFRHEMGTDKLSKFPYHCSSASRSLVLMRFTGALGEQCTTGSPFEVILIFGLIDGRFSAGSGLAKPRLINSAATSFNFWFSCKARSFIARMSSGGKSIVVFMRQVCWLASFLSSLLLDCNLLCCFGFVFFLLFLWRGGIGFFFSKIGVLWKWHGVFEESLEVVEHFCSFSWVFGGEVVFFAEVIGEVVELMVCGGDSFDEFPIAGADCYCAGGGSVEEDGIVWGGCALGKHGPEVFAVERELLGE